MVRFRSISTNDELLTVITSQRRLSIRALRSPKSPLSPKTPRTPRTPSRGGGAFRFDFTTQSITNNNTNVATNASSSTLRLPSAAGGKEHRVRSVSLSHELEKVIAFKSACRKYSLCTEIGDGLAHIGDEIYEKYGTLFQNIDMTAVCRALNTTTRRSISRRRKISDLLGQVILQIILNA